MPPVLVFVFPFLPDEKHPSCFYCGLKSLTNRLILLQMIMIGR